MDWSTILATAATIVETYDTLVTLRQLFYRLVAAGRLPNTQTAYKQLSARTAEARRAGTFPNLIDRTRQIHRARTFPDPSQARRWLHAIYRRDRTEGQPVSLYLGVEKAGIIEQLGAWFGDLGLPILALGGYSSQSYIRETRADVRRQDRPAVLLYAGDFDPSGVDIDRDFLERTDCFDQFVRVALDADQVDRHGLPPQMGKATDSRAAKFVAKHGRLVQVELDALPPDTLRSLYAEAIANFWDMSAYQRTVGQETADRRELEQATR